eukprot:SAG31_NODE_3108_length_4666_cov_2.823336_3_plen_111_part_00
MDALAGAVYAEKFAKFTKELAVNVAKSTTGEVVAHPCVETIQKNNICHSVIAPARVSKSVQDEAQALCKQAVDALPGLTGIVGVELFLLEDGTVRLHSAHALETANFMML